MEGCDDQNLKLVFFKVFPLNKHLVDYTYAQVQRIIVALEFVMELDQPVNGVLSVLVVDLVPQALV